MKKMCAWLLFVISACTMTGAAEEMNLKYRLGDVSFFVRTFGLSGH